MTITLLKNKWFYISLTGITLIIFLILWGLRPEKPIYETATVLRGYIIQEVSLTGSVKPASDVSLAFEKGGKIVRLPQKVGDRVVSGQLVAEISNLDLVAQLRQSQATYQNSLAQLRQYEASRDSQKAKLDEYLAGSRPEQITIAKNNVFNAEKTLADTELNLQNITNKTEKDLSQIYNNTLNTIAYSVTIAENSLYALTDIMDNVSFTSDKTIIAEKKANAVLSLLGAVNGGYFNKSTLSSLNGGAKGDVLKAQQEPTNENISTALNSVKNALYVLKNSFGGVPLSVDMSATDIATINTQKGYIDTEISSVIAKEQSIFVQLSTNQNSIDTAKASLTTAENSLQSAKDQLNLTLAGYTPQQISSQESLLKQAQASVDAQKAMVRGAEAGILNIQAQIEKTILKTPIDGIITLVDAKVGEIISPNKAVVKVISESKYQIEANVPEVDIANIKLDDFATITLDAYSSEIKFEAKVIKIDPAETLIDNVPTYKITLEFNEEDELIKSGMTADIDILTNEMKNVLYIPQRAILKKDNKKIVRVLKNNEMIEEKTVETGLKNSSGQIEIKNGLSENEIIIVSTKTK